MAKRKVNLTPSTTTPEPLPAPEEDTPVVNAAVAAAAASPAVGVDPQTGEPVKVGPTVNPRNEALKRMARTSMEETGNLDALPMTPDETSIADGATPVNRETLAREAGNQAAAEEVSSESPPPTAVSAPPPEAKKVHKVEVRGVVTEVPEDQVLEAGKHALRHRGAAEAALRDAHELLNRARAATGEPAPARPTGSPASDITEDAKGLAKALQFGSQEDATRAVEAMLRGGHAPANIQDVIARTVETHVRDVTNHEAASKALEAQVPEMLTDTRIIAMLSFEERAARAAGDTRPYSELYPEIGKKVRDWLDGLKGPVPAAPASGVPAQTIQQRAEAKRSVPAAIPPAGGAPTQPTQPKVKTGSEIVAEMRASRGNPDYRFRRI